MKVICGAIERIDDPLIFGFFILATTFFCINAMIRVGLFQYLDDCGFGLLIDFRHKIITAFGGNREPVDPVHVAHNYISSRTRSAHGDINHWMHDSFSKSGDNRGRSLAE